MPFFSRLRRSVRRQVLFFVHGFNCQPEARVFPDALRLQALCDALAPDLVEVVPLIWPCDDDFGLVLDYWDDQQSATVSGLALARMLGKFIAWRDRLGTEETCLKHVNILAHSMGNRVLATALASWAHDYGAVPALFRNVFMAAADVANDLFAPGQPGTVIAGAARNVVVYHAADDFALRSSKVVNLRTASSAAASAIPARPSSSGRRATSSPSTATTSTAATTGWPFLLPGRPRRPARAPCCGIWSRPCAPAGSPASRPTGAGWCFATDTLPRPSQRTTIVLRRARSSRSWPRGAPDAIRRRIGTGHRARHV